MLSWGARSAELGSTGRCAGEHGALSCVARTLAARVSRLGASCDDGFPFSRRARECCASTLLTVFLSVQHSPPVMLGSKPGLEAGQAGPSWASFAFPAAFRAPATCPDRAAPAGARSGAVPRFAGLRPRSPQPRGKDLDSRTSDASASPVCLPSGTGLAGPAALGSSAHREPSPVPPFGAPHAYTSRSV